MTASIHGDLEVRADADTASMPWVPSPGGQVFRKRVHLVGPPEAGQVTSVVRYQPGARFPAHDHPEGEEILVLEGIFSDIRGDWPAGSYLLNPEGFRHAPFSTPGCLLFVKLRQFAGARRRQMALAVDALPWQAGEGEGVERRALYEQEGFADRMDIERWAPGADPGERIFAAGVEIFVLEGAFEDEAGTHPVGSWLRLPRGAVHRAKTWDGCRLYVKRGGLAALRSAPPAAVDRRSCPRPVS
jgi:anti-sigma factor ChrR (cupin superfamily)